MSKKILCIYYSRTGHTAKLMDDIARELGCELVKLSDGVDRSGLMGWLRSGRQAMSRALPRVEKPETALPLSSTVISRSERRLFKSSMRRRMIFPMLSFVNGLNMMISSSLFKNSGRKCPLNSPMTASSHAGLMSPLSSIPSNRCAEPRFDVIMMIVFLKSTVLPCESVIRPSSSTCNSTLNTSGCAFSTSSKRTTEYGFLRTASVS